MKYRRLEKLTNVIARRLEERQLRPGRPALRGEKNLKKVMTELRNTIEELRVTDEELRLRNVELLATHGDLDRERRRYQELFDLAPDGYVVTNWEGVILESNEAFSAMLGLSRKTLVRKPLAVYVAPVDLRVFRSILSGLKTAGATETFELFLQPRKKPAFPVQITVAVGREPGKPAPLPRWLIRDITERKQVETVMLAGEAALRQSQDELRTLTAELMTAQEEERRRISRDLHDDTNQRVALLSMNIETLLKDVPSSDPMHQPLQAFHAQVVELSEHLRQMAHQLHSSMLDDLGLPVTLERYARDYAQRTGIACDIAIKKMPESLPQNTAAGLYRILQEGLGNILKHARATHVAIKLSGSNGQVQLSIQDNGIGFDRDHPRNHKEGLGFISMRERVRQLDGKFSMQSQRGQGTTISVKVPIA